MIELESSCDLNGIPRPVQCRGLSKQRTATPIEQAANNLMFWVVIGSLEVFVHIKSSITPHTFLETVIVWVGEPL